MYSRKIILILEILDLFVACTAVVGGVLILKGTIVLSPAWLHNSFSSSYTIPALCLIFIVGGSNLLAGIIAMVNKQYGSFISLLSGFILLEYLIIEIGVIGLVMWLQVLYILISIVMIFLSILLRNIENK